MPPDLLRRISPVPRVEQQPEAVNGGGEDAEGDDHFQVEAVQELLEFVHGEEDGVPVHILPGHKIDHADGLTGQLELHGAYYIALLDGSTDVVRQVEIFLGDGAVAGGGQQGHHVVIGVKLQGVGVRGILDRNFGQG